MGNTPTKEARPRLSSLLSFGTGHSAVSGARNPRRHTMLSSQAASGKAGGKTEEKLRAKEQHAMALVVRFRDNADGGYLAPFGTYKLNLDFDTQVVRRLVLERRLAPFYTPLQDFDASWTDDELVALVRQSPLHALDAAYGDDDEPDDLEDHKIRRPLNLHKRQEQRKRLQEMLARVAEQQRQCESEYLDARTAAGAADAADPDLASRDLVLRLYRGAAECPICFLYFPCPLNYSRCCRQPICTECFVQIKRLDPHPPHDDAALPLPGELPHTLISEPAHCPYCAMTDFGVTYDPPGDVHVGRGAACKPSEYSEKSLIKSIPEDAEESVEFVDGADPQARAPPPASPRKPRRRSSVAAESDAVITTDAIRPEWELKLAAAKSRLARKAAAASAIHASNLIMNDEGSSSRSRAGHSPRYYMSLEDRMMEEAMKLLLLEEEERVARAQRLRGK
ncbi:hypothetical protein METBIDRAFT_147877 [Metschnikowia bicuspidata var. bicuspidata NRRL YB-4993]|uniref:Protein SIP5 n=1 Tax=Metschnikowia bicuspidata var. bicuspidata NRRL YB-4993 TaxID=869754 RepID=A0A1A0HE37_9ASCO|nr:hypothetical protein METBIDRAFT_147877 [Metschnikowia bicuspidata var. bicuspidata NRRL YB-4993]OBA22168.1 hypothetical protein METBIDRAFT_147877 [Metschnikowia bicuspidata var. bicuspidata NRRL YB-4993]